MLLKDLINFEELDYHFYCKLQGITWAHQQGWLLSNNNNTTGMGRDDIDS